MPATLEELAASAGLPVETARRVAAFVEKSARPFQDTVDLSLELLGGVIPAWPLLEAWNRWCVGRGVSFFVWQPVRGELSDRTRLEALIHTIMMVAAKERNVRTLRRAGFAEAEVVMAGDDCVICDEHRHRVVPLDPAPLAELPPFHPGCRCGTLPQVG